MMTLCVCVGGGGRTCIHTAVHGRAVQYMKAVLGINEDSSCKQQLARQRAQHGCCEQHPEYGGLLIVTHN
jgi:hypothetical protein